MDEHTRLSLVFGRGTRGTLVREIFFGQWQSSFSISEIAKIVVHEKNRTMVSGIVRELFFKKLILKTKLKTQGGGAVYCPAKTATTKKINDLIREIKSSY